MKLLRYLPNRLASDIARSVATITPPPLAEVYLLRRRPVLGVFLGLPYSGLLHWGSPPKARLELTDDSVRCTLVDKSGNAGWLARRLRVPDLKKRLRAGLSVTVFEFPRGGYDITWPDTSLGAVFEISQGGADSWVVSFMLPAEYEDFDFFRYFNAARAYQTRGIRRQWRQALDPARNHIPSS